MQNFKDLYLELAELLSEIPELRWIDMWHNQVNFLEDEHQFPTPAAFFSFRTLTTEDLGERMQNLRLQVDVFFFYETFADTYKDAVNQGSALEFLDIFNSIYIKLHATSGENYSELRRIGFNPVDTGGAGNLYQMSFECGLIDLSAKIAYEEADTDELTVNDTEPDEVDYDNAGLPTFEMQ